MAVLGVALAMGGCGAPEGADPGVTLVNESVPHHALLDDVLAVKHAGGTDSLHFSYLPKDRPDGLQRMLSGGAGVTGQGVTNLVDIYQVADGPVQVLIEYAPQPTDTCRSFTRAGGAALCLKQETLAAAADDPRMRHVTVYLSGTSDQAVVEKIRKAWSAVRLAPAEDVRWFADLRSEANAAPKHRAG